MSSRSNKRAFFAGVLLANAVPHVATAAAKRIHLTPLAGKRSSPLVNAVWASANAATGIALLYEFGGTRRWDGRLHWVEAGVATMSAGMFGMELLAPMNAPSRRGESSDILVP